MKKLIIFLFLSIIFINNAKADDKKLLKEFSLEEQVGQMIMVGFRGFTTKDDPTVSYLAKENKIGGIIYFDYDMETKESKRNIKNPNQVKKLSEDFQNLNPKLPLLIAVDQEGGKVQRLKQKYGFPENVSAQKLGDLNDLTLTKWEAVKTGETLKHSGINVNFAPVLDVNINPENPAIGKLQRSYSSNPDVVYKHAKTTIEGLNEKDIISCVKHFPGHGSAFNDSHLGLTDISDTFKEIELDPYKKLIQDNKLEMVMMGHLFNKNVDKNYPASISKKYSDLLRKDLGFNGVIITDDMQMKAITDNYSLLEQIELFLDSSADIILFGNNLIYEPKIAEKTYNIILNKAKHDKKIEERINKSFKRIYTLKQKLK